jgi:glycosyltransferase involved in cell wall biosynthesis
MVRIGWIADVSRMSFSGAAMSSSELAVAAPSGVTIVPCPPGCVVSDVDAYVVFNCTQYDSSLIPIIGQKPVIKSVRDQWPDGDDDLRSWLLSNARLTIFNSLPHLKWFAYKVDTPTAYVPPPVDIQKFRDAAQNVGDRDGTMWLGLFFPNKSILEAVHWANHNKQEVHFYGDGPYRPRMTAYTKVMGVVQYEDVPALMARYKRFLYFSRAVESFGRTIAEAWASGMELLVTGMTGAMWWIENDPDALDCGAEDFWRLVLDAL